MIGSGLCFVGMAWCVKKRGPVFTAAFSPFIQIMAAMFDIPILHEQLHIGRYSTVEDHKAISNAGTGLLSMNSIGFLLLHLLIYLHQSSQLGGIDHCDNWVVRSTVGQEQGNAEMCHEDRSGTGRSGRRDEGAGARGRARRRKSPCAGSVVTVMEVQSPCSDWHFRFVCYTPGPYFYKIRDG